MFNNSSAWRTKITVVYCRLKISLNKPQIIGSKYNDKLSIIRSSLFADGRTDWAGKTKRYFSLKQAIKPAWHNGCILPFASKDIQSLHFVTHCNHVYNIDDPSVSHWLRCCATNRKIGGSIAAGVIGIFHWHKILPIALWSQGDSASSRNEYQEHFLGVKTAGA